jgi:hypothetical protein
VLRETCKGRTSKVWEIEKKLRVSVLDPLFQETLSGNWTKGGLVSVLLKGIKEYCAASFIKSSLSPDFTQEDDILEAQMLCLETICLGLLYLESHRSDALIPRIQETYPEIISATADNHPYYFHDGGLYTSFTA